MNYIQKLQSQREQLIDEKREALDLLQDLRIYLSSDKFANDTTVQVRDVLNRLEPLRSALIGSPLER